MRLFRVHISKNKTSADVIFSLFRRQIQNIVRTIWCFVPACVWVYMGLSILWPFNMTLVTEFYLEIVCLTFDKFIIRHTEEAILVQTRKKNNKPEYLNSIQNRCYCSFALSVCPFTNIRDTDKHFTWNDCEIKSLTNKALSQQQQKITDDGTEKSVYRAR